MAMASRPHHRLLFDPTGEPIPCEPFPQCLFPPEPLLPLPPPPPPPPYEDPATTIRLNRQHSSLVPILPVAAACLVAAAALAILVTFFFLRLRRRRLGLLNAAPPGADAPLDEEDGGGEEVTHHVWYIRTVGLDESTIGTITAWAYKADDGVLGASTTDCAVCLSEFCDGELVRLLPKCGHAFHVSCIDTWLRSHVNCPLCRTPVVTPTSAANSGDPGTSASSSSSSSARSSLPSPESSLNHTEPNSVASAQVDTTQTDGDGQQLEDDRGTIEEEMDGERLELGGRSRTAIDPIASPQLLVSIDIVEDGFQPIRRSASMGAIIGALELEEGLCEILSRKKPALEAEWNHRTRVKHSSRVTSLRKEVERSSGSCSERFFLSIRGRGRSSFLPL